MDRNLGARRVATAINDVLSYGNHYQWGRPADGHEISVWNGATLTSGRGFYDATALEDLSATTTPGHPNFILTNVDPFDWLATQADPDRWASANQGPCPAGYHVPTNAEWDIADTAPLGSGNGTDGSSTTGWDNNTETYESALKLPSAGFRSRQSGLFTNQGIGCHYWSSSLNALGVYYLLVRETIAYTAFNYRSTGFSVRCIKD